jgi:hypothetical protein
LFDFDHKDVVVELGTKRTEKNAELEKHVGINWDPLPMSPLPQHADSSTDQVNVAPPTTKHLRTPETNAFHEQDRRPLVGEGHGADPLELIEARAVDIRLSLWWSADLPRWVSVDQILSLRPSEERVKDRDHV